MTNPTVTIHDVSTGEVVEREMNADELKQHKIDQAETQAKSQAEAEMATAKAALLEKLGITSEEAALLLS